MLTRKAITMAIFNVNVDNSPVRFDSGSLFGGLYERLGVDDSAILKKVNINGIPALVQTNSAYGIPGLDGQYSDYRLVWLGNINIKERWDGKDSNNGQFQDLGNTFELPTGESVSSDYKLDWTKAQFASIAFQVPSATATPSPNNSDWSSWTTIRELATTNSFLDLPLRANEYDSNWVGEKRSNFHNSKFGNNFNQQGLFETAFEYQSVVFNWQYPFGTTNAQYLFGNDLVNGSRNDDVLRGYAGDDIIRGNAGNDLLYADYGRDQLFGGPGNDVLVFGGSSSSWDVTNFKYRSSSPELAVGGSGSDFFVFRPSEIMWTAREDVFYDMHLPSLYNGRFKYKKVDFSDIYSEDLFTGYSPFRVNAIGDIVSGPTDNIMVIKAAFNTSNNPFQKFQPIDVYPQPGTTGSGSSLKSVLNAVTLDKNNKEIIIGQVNPDQFDPSRSSEIHDFIFYVDDKNAILKLPNFNAFNIPIATTPTLVKAGVFTASNTPYLKSQGLEVDVNSDGDIIANGFLEKLSPNFFINRFLKSETFVKSGQDVFLDRRAGDQFDNFPGQNLDTRVYTDDAVYTRNKNDNWHYNPFMSQYQNDAYNAGTTGATRANTDPGNGVSNLTQRIRVQDFKIGSDKLDLSAFGLTNEILSFNAKTLDGKTGTSYLTALSAILKPEGLKITAAKTAWTSGSTALFIKEDNADTNGNSTKDDTLLEIQLVGINISSINGRFFGELPSEIAADMLPGYLTY